MYRKMCNLVSFVLCFSLMVMCWLHVDGKNVHSPAGSRTSDGCESTNSFFELRNISVNIGTNDKDTVCGGRCCTADGEALLRDASRKDLEFQLRHHARSLRSRLGITAVTTRDHVMELAKESENKTIYLFTKIYKNMAVLAKSPITYLYADLKRYINITDENSIPTDINIENSVMEFFTKLFPLIYHQAVNVQQRDFSQEYKSCLKRAIGDIQPFGEIPKQISKSIVKSLEATRILLQAFWLGADVLNTTDTLLGQESEKASSCYTALLKMSYCPKCLGLDVKVKPCSGLCQNVVRGCLTQHISALDHPWNSYIGALEKLVLAVKTHETGAGVNVDAVMRDLDSRITEAIMYAMENGASLEKKVNRACGHAKLSEIELPSDTEFSDSPSLQQRPHPQRPSRGGANLRTTPIDAEMLHFLTLVEESKGFFLNLADTICRDENFADQRENGADCWNGERIGQYTKTVVGANPSYQKYNPEVDIPAMVAGQESPISDSRVSKLSDQLRHITKSVLSQLTPSLPASDSYMQGDEAGSVEGSGSGRSMDRFSDDEEGGRDGSSWSDGQDYDGSGSGNGEIENDDRVRIHKPDGSGKSEENSVTGGSNRAFAACTWITSLMLFMLHHYSNIVGQYVVL